MACALDVTMGWTLQLAHGHSGWLWSCQCRSGGGHYGWGEYPSGDASGNDHDCARNEQGEPPPGSGSGHDSDAPGAYRERHSHGHTRYGQACVWIKQMRLLSPRDNGDAMTSAAILPLMVHDLSYEIGGKRLLDGISFR